MSSQELKKAGLKVTVPRLKILEVLETCEQCHMSAEDIYRALLERGEEIGLATVYRVLTQFEAAGLVLRHRFEGDHSVFELEPGNHHDHMLCVKCGKIVEFADPVIEKRQREIAAQAGFEITDHSLYLFGLCADCNSPGRQDPKGKG